MKLGRLLIVCVAVLLPMTAHADQLGVTFLETINGPGLDTLSVNLAGAVITGSPDDWFINLNAAGVTLSNGDLPQVFQSPLLSGYNVLSIVNSQTLQLQAGVANSRTPDDNCGTGSPLRDGTSCYIGSGNGNDYFGTVEQRAPAPAITPEPATLTLFGTGLLALASLKSKLKRHTS